MRNSKVSMMALMAAAALGSIATTAPLTSMSEGRVMTVKAGDTSPVQGRIAQSGAQDRRTRRVVKGTPFSGLEQRRRSGPGWTNMHAKRVAAKKRNVKRFRAQS